MGQLRIKEPVKKIKAFYLHNEVLPSTKIKNEKWFWKEKIVQSLNHFYCTWTALIFKLFCKALYIFQYPIFSFPKLATRYLSAFKGGVTRVFKNKIQSFIWNYPIGTTHVTSDLRSFLEYPIVMKQDQNWLLGLQQLYFWYLGIGRGR